MSILMRCLFKVGVHKVGFNCVRNLLVINEGRVVITQTQSLVQREFTSYNEG